MNDVITIKPNDINLLAEESGKAVISPKAEESLVKLINIYKHLGEVIDIVKKNIEKSGLEIDEGFTGVVGEKVGITYRPFGEKYTYTDFDKARAFLREKSYVKVDTTLVDAYRKQHKKLPEGIAENERIKSIVFSLSEEV